jgi:cytochrome b6-f complex iron-sulfur subunit
MDRRRFLELSQAALAAVLLPACASVAAMRVPAPGGVVRLSLREHPALLQAGGALRIQPDGLSDPVYLLTLEDGTYAALSPVCTHRGCTVGIEGPHLVCPCHGSTYDRTGGVLRGPAERALQRYPTRVTAGDLIIELGGVR